MGAAQSSWPFLSACYCWLRDQFGEFSEVLCCGCELELFVCAFGSSKSHHRHTDVTLQVGKQHLDFPPLEERCQVGIGFSDIARNISGRFVDGPHHASSRITWAALRLERTRVAIMLRSAVSHEPVFAAIGLSRLGEVPAVCPQLFVARACVAIGRGVLDEVFARECAVRPFGFIPNRNVWSDSALFHQPPELYWLDKHLKERSAALREDIEQAIINAH